MVNKWEFWGSISLLFMAIGTWLLVYKIPQIFPFCFLFGGMFLFLVMLACLIGQDEKALEEMDDVKTTNEELSNCMVDLMFICQHIPSGQIKIRDLVSLMVRKGHRIRCSCQAIKVLLKYNRLASRNGYLYYFDNQKECSDFKAQTKLNGLKSSLNK